MINIRNIRLNEVKSIKNINKNHQSFQGKSHNPEESLIQISRKSSGFIAHKYQGHLTTHKIRMKTWNVAEIKL